MSVTASFKQDRIDAGTGQPTAHAQHMHNTTDDERKVTLRAGGGLAEQTVLQTETIYLDPNEHFEVPITVDAHAALPAGSHSCVIEVVDGDDTATAAATIDIDATAAWASRLEPRRSRSASAGRHKVVIENQGNVPVTAELVSSAAPEIDIEIAAPLVNIDPGKTAKVELRATPDSRFWSGATVEHPFSVAVSGSNGDNAEGAGGFEQTPRVRPGRGPALAGMIGGLALGALAWFTVLEPSVLDQAQTDADALDSAQLDAIDERVAAIEAAAEEAAELPLGVPIDERLTVSAAAGVSSTQTFDFGEEGDGQVLSLTDVIFQNPTGAIGTVELLRDDDILLQQGLENFRDRDFHLVAPLQIRSGSTLALRVTCEAPGAAASECDVAATVTGFVDGP